MHHLKFNAYVVHKPSSCILHENETTLHNYLRYKIKTTRSLKKKIFNLILNLVMSKKEIDILLMS